MVKKTEKSKAVDNPLVSKKERIWGCCGKNLGEEMKSRICKGRIRFQLKLLNSLGENGEGKQ